MTNQRTERDILLKSYKLYADSFLERLRGFGAFGVDVSELEELLNKIGLTLITTPFVGLVVSTPPPPHQKFTSSDINDTGTEPQNPEFCTWFNNLSNPAPIERQKGATAYRITQINPICTVEPVTFVDDGVFIGTWLSEEQLEFRFGPTKK